MNVILFGPPGAGKGTQSDFITKSFNLHKVSTGDLLRNEVYKKTNIGNKIKSIMDKGIFVSNEIINDLIEKVLSIKKFYNRLIFDGYPRNLDQAKTLDSILKKNDQKIDLVISLKVGLDVIIKRITGRIVCSKCGAIYNEFFNPPVENKNCCNKDTLKRRSDDSAEVAKKRFDTYTNTTEPIFEHYKKSGLIREISGENKIDGIFNKIAAFIK